jgi:non-specific protein-tyrosine kinase
MNEDSALQIERYLRLVNRRKWVVIIPVLLAVGAALLVSYVSSPVYTASSTARIDVTSQDPSLQDIGPADRYINTYAAIIEANGFLDRVIEDLNLDTTAKSLKKRVSTSRIAGTELVRVTAKAGTADEAASIANGLAALLANPEFVSQFVPDSEGALTSRIEATRGILDDENARLADLAAGGGSASQIASQEAVVRSLESTLQSLIDQRAQATVKQSQAIQGFTVIEEADPPDSPTSPRWGFNLGAGLLAGLVVGIALALVLEYIDPTLRDVRQLEAVTRLPVLASIPFGIRWKYPPPPVSPDYRLLATKLQTAVQEQQRKSILFTSSRAEEGCTTVATYSAMAMAQAGLRVLLVDANLNRPDLHRLFNLPIAPGVYNFISTNGVRPTRPMTEAAVDAVQNSPVRGLSVLTAGTKMNDPSELLASAEMRELLDFLETRWDAVVIDGSAMQSSAGSAVIAPVVDGVVLVAAEGQASSKSVEETVDELTSLGAKPLGLVYCKATEA